MIRTAKLVDFRQESEWYHFQFTAEGADVFRVEELLKMEPLSRRAYDPRTKTWRLRVSPGSDRLLAETFTNGRQCIESVGEEEVDTV